MRKMTLKYVAANIAAESFIETALIERMSHDELYSALSARGYRWTGETWERETATLSGPDTLIRVMGDISEVENVTLNIAAALVARGYQIARKTGVYKNYDGNDVRQYLTVSKGVRKNGQ